ncbi:YaeQ family protein [Bdellovibrio sp. SKB1291214]|uniref:YaeQ family protein n=1 Tax=Bdellovibrio sp. SKB1291214 TaxID=1732569 RepID=UPI000B51BD8E|nr:YaeQ family protein [Bdellovibrio sp. SKB1291214]UYL09324.1 YaeQ family protein [Bdellovibrio sp. SKB1291214]
MLYRFQIELSDIDRGVYESLDFRVAQHPSETYPYMLSRVFAYCLAYQDRLEFTPGGLADPEAPALRKLGLQNEIETWIEIGNPSSRKLHKASKTAKEVLVFTYKNPEVLLTEIRGGDVHRASEIKIYSFDGDFLTAVSNSTEKNNRWALLVQQGQMDLTIAEETFSGEIKTFNI